MKKENVSHIISSINEKYIDEATVFAVNSGDESGHEQTGSADRQMKRPRRFVWSAAAACVVLVAVIGSAAFAVAAEAKEYNDAVAFFEENGLSAEGLTRSEVKAVYRDITEQKFSYDKTEEVIRQTVPGMEIQQEEPGPEDLAALWNRNISINTVTQNGISFRIGSEYKHDEKRGFDVLDRSILECYRDGEPFWTAEFRDFYIERYSCTKYGTVVWGLSETFSSSDTIYGWIALIDSEGKTMWQKRLDHGFRYEYVGSVLNNGDGTWAVISRGDMKYLCLSCYDHDGNELSFHKTEVGNLGIWNAARLGDGYIVQLGNTTTRDTALICRLDREGNVTDRFSYEAEDCEYYITDMTEFAGHIYLSAYAVPMQDDEGGRYEIGNVLEYIFSKDGWMDISDEELTPLVRDNYTAVLLVCDPENGSPKTFYSVRGSLGGSLSVSVSGELEWNVESVASTFFSPMTSSFTIGGVCNVIRYMFFFEGVLTGQTDTGETVAYRR